MSWEMVEISKVANVITGTTPSKSNNEFYEGGDIPFVTPRELGANHPIHKATTYLTDKGFLKANVVPKFSILVCCIGSIGKMGIAGREIATNQQINSVVFDSSLVDYRYGYRALSNVKSTMINSASSTTIAILNKSNFERIKIPLPPLPEQQRIANILDKAEAINQKREQVLALCDEFLRATFLDMFGDPVSNPKGWEFKDFAELGELNRGKSKHRPRNDPKLLGGDYPLIQTGDVANSKGYITNFTSTYSEFGLKQSKLWSKGTLCITIAANIAKTGILTFDACFPDSVVGFEANDLVTIEYIQSWLGFLQKTLEDQAPESAQKNINLAILKALSIPTPPIELQQKFSSIVEKINGIKARIQDAQELPLFDALSQQAFKGELTQ